MGRWWWPAGYLAILLSLLSGCSEGSSPEQARAGQAVAVSCEYKGQQGPFPERSLMVVQRPEVWHELWAGAKAPEVDFSKESVIVALMGKKPTVGYETAITDVRVREQKAVAYISETQPAAKAIGAQIMSFPYHMVVVPKVTQPVSVIGTGDADGREVIQDEFVGTQRANVTPQTLVIRDVEHWQRLWHDILGAGDAPVLDFTQYNAVAVLLGSRPTGGYSVFIPAIVHTDDRLNVNFRVRGPAADAAPVGVTAPYAIAVIHANTLPIAFRRIETLVKTKETEKAMPAADTAGGHG